MNKMNKLNFLVAGSLAVLALGAALLGEASDSHRKIVVFDKAHYAVADNAVAKHSGLKIANIDFINAKVIDISENGASALKHEPGVLSVEEDAVVTAQVTDRASAEKFSGSGAGGTTPSPQVLPWGIDKLDAELVWAPPTGGSNTANTVKVGVIDTGISSNHPDLAGNIKGGVNFVITRGKLDQNKWNDDNGHGSHVAGIIAALNNSQGVVGVAPDADLYAIKVLSANGSGYMSDVILGIGWATTHGMNVINMSFGCACDSQALHDAVINAYNAGVIEVAAAGNDSAQPVIFPAAYPEVIAVGAIDRNNQIASWSSFGPEVDISAPGVDIYSTYKGTGYAFLSGTSMASPHVVGAVALLLNTPVGNFDELANGKWDLSEVKAKLMTSSQDLGTQGWDAYFGGGLVNALSLVTQ